MNDEDRSVPALKGKSKTKKPRAPKPAWRVTFSLTRGSKSKTLSYTIRRDGFPGSSDAANAIRIACWWALRDINPNGVDWNHASCMDITNWTVTVEYFADTVCRDGCIIEVES